MTLPDRRPASSANARSAAPKGRAPTVLASEESNTIRARANWPMILAADPANFEIGEVDGKPAILPVLVPLPLRPGCNGVTTRDRNQPTSLAVKQATRYAEERGMTVLPPSLTVEAEHLPPGVDAGPYYREYACKEHKDAPVKAYYREAWDVARATPPNETQAFKHDRAAYNRWRKHLLDSGAVPAPSELVVERLLGRARDHLTRIESASHPDPTVRKAKVGRATAVVNAAEQAAA